MNLNWLLAFLFVVVIVLSPAVALYLLTGSFWFGLLGIAIGIALLIVLPTIGARVTIALGGRADKRDAEHERIRHKLENPGDQFAGPFAQSGSANNDRD